MLPFIERFLKHLAPAITKTCVSLTEWEMRTANYTAPGEYQWSDAAPRAIRVGDHWGMPGVTAFLQRSVEIPAGCQGQKVGLALVTGGEALVRINKQPYHGLDANRWFVPLTEKGTGGETYEVQIEAFNPVPVVADVMNKPGTTAAYPNRTLERAELVVLNQAAADLWYSLRVYFDAAQTLPENSPSRQRLIKSMEQVVEEFEVADFDNIDATAVEKALSDLRQLASQLSEKQPGMMRMVGQSHIDVAWLWPVRETVRKISRTFSTAVTLMDEYPHYLFSQSQAQVYAFAKQYYPELYARIKEKVKDGRWEIVGGMWVEPDLNIPSGEALVRQVLFGQRFWQKEFGIRSTVEWLPDTFGYNAALPQILRKAGIDSFMTVKMYWNDTNKFPYDLFWWEGVDGTRILSFINHGLNEPATARDVRAHWDAYKQKSNHPEGMYLYGHGDGGGGVTREMLEYIAREGDMPGLPKVSTGKAHDFFAGIHAAQPELPTWRGDLYLELHRGTYTSQAKVKQNNRRGEFLLHDAELWNAAASTLGKPYPHELINQAWEKLLLNQFHDILPGSSVPSVYEETSESYPIVQELGNKARSSALDILAETTDTRGPGQPVIAYNSLSWQRTDVVRLPYETAAAVGAVVDHNGQVLPMQWVDTLTGQRELWFLAPDVPSLGQQTYWLQKAASDQAGAPQKALQLPTTWETARSIVVFNTKGQIERFYDKDNSREVVPSGQIANQLQLYVDRPLHWDAWDVDPRYTDMPFEDGELISADIVSQGPVADIIRFSWKIGTSVITQDAVLYQHTARVDFVTHVSWQEAHHMLKVAFPVEVLAAQATYEIPFGSIQRSTSNNTSWERAQHEVCGHKWADISEGNYGVSLMNDCKYGYDVKGNVLRLTLLRAPQYPDPKADVGEHEFVYSLFPHAGDWRTGTVQAAFALNVPLIAKAAAAHPGTLPANYSIAGLDVDHVILDTVKAAEDSQDIVLRFYEAHGARGPVTAQIKLPVRAAAETNLLEDPERAVEIKDGALTFEIKPYEIKTFRLQVGS